MKMLDSFFRQAVVATLVLGAMPLGCGATDSVSGDSARESVGEALFTPSGVTLWNANSIGTGATIDVCFAVRPRLEPNGHVECPLETDSTKDCSGRTVSVDGLTAYDTSTLRAVVQQQVTATWEQHGNLTFNWKGDCPIVNNQHRNIDLGHTVVIQFRQAGAVAPASSCTSDVSCEARFPNSFCQIAVGQGAGLCMPNPSVDWTGILGRNSSVPTVIQYNWPVVINGVDKFNVIHEFGHALGFAHEWARTDYVDPVSAAWRAGHGNCTSDASCNVAGAPGGKCRTTGTAAGLCVCDDEMDSAAPLFSFTPAPGDTASIMNYSCHANSSPDLSGQDLTGIRAAYGNKEIGGSAGHRLSYFFCAGENETCVLGGAKYVAFGANGSYLYKAVTGNVACTLDAFGGDPAPGIVKACYFANYAFKLNEGASGSVGVGARDIAFGANGFFNFKRVGATFTCDRATFGDPLVGAPKACYSALPGFIPTATENGSLTNLNRTPVAYGANGKFIFKLMTGSATCSFRTFGYDPAVGIAKSCYVPSFGPVVADEGQAYNFGGPASVLYGSGLNGNFLPGSLPSATCSNTTFGGDPEAKLAKHCYGTALF